MKDQRLQVFRTAVQGLIESLEAVVRLSRWDSTDAKPEPLVASAAKLVDRLGAADRLATTRFNGPATEAAKVTAMCAAMQRLDVAYRAYRHQMESAHDRADAAALLETEIAATSAGAAAWR
jgi:hypothetical protein